MKNKIVIMVAGLILTAGSLIAEPTLADRKYAYIVDTGTMKVTLWKWSGMKLQQPGAPEKKGFSPHFYPFPKTRVKSESVRLLRNDADLKVVQWKTQTFEHRFGAVVRGETDYCFKKGFPCVFIRMRLFNTGPEKANLNLTLGFSAVKSPEMPGDGGVAKVDGQPGEQKVMNVKNHFFYTDPDGFSWGIVSVDLEKPERQLFANIPIRNKGTWLLGYMKPGNVKEFAKGEFSRVNAVIFPAKNPGEVKQMYEKLSADRSLDFLWKYLE